MASLDWGLHGPVTSISKVVMKWPWPGRLTGECRYVASEMYVWSGLDGESWRGVSTEAVGRRLRVLGCYGPPSHSSYGVCSERRWPAVYKELSPCWRSRSGSVIIHSLSSLCTCWCTLDERLPPCGKGWIYIPAKATFVFWAFLSFLWIQLPRCCSSFGDKSSIFQLCGWPACGFTSVCDQFPFSLFLQTVDSCWSAVRMLMASWASPRSPGTLQSPCQLRWGGDVPWAVGRGRTFGQTAQSWVWVMNSLFNRILKAQSVSVFFFLFYCCVAPRLWWSGVVTL